MSAQIFRRAAELFGARSGDGAAKATAVDKERFKARMALAQSYYSSVASEIDKWARYSREDDNFSFDLTQQNLNYLAATVAALTGAPIDRVSALMSEPDHDLKSFMETRAATLPIDSPTGFGRRLGWYAIARITKPTVIIETGVRHGLGSVLLCSALQRNSQEGSPGKYFGTDIDPAAGVLLAAPFDAYGQILYGDSIKSLQSFDQKIDLFINDSDHSAEYEYQEYLTIKDKLSPRGIILGDNAHSTDSLFRFSRENGRRFLFFKEQPKDHWYPGAGIGISLP
jgi:predicted O-methyltransferase YrrM